MVQNGRAERWGLDTGTHSHYSRRVKDALNEYHEKWAEYNSFKHINLIDNMHRQSAVQEAFDRLVSLRKEETGVGAYLNEEQYQKVKK